MSPNFSIGRFRMEVTEWKEVLANLLQLKAA